MKTAKRTTTKGAGNPAPKPRNRTKDTNLLVLDMIGSGGFAGTTDGQKIVARFCRAVLSGGSPDSNDMAFIANALLPIVHDLKVDTDDVMTKVAKRLKLTKKQGRQERDFGEIGKLARPVMKYLKAVERHQADGMNRAAAEKAARDEIADQLGIGDRAMRDRIKNHRAHAEWLLLMYEGLGLEV